MRRCPTCNRTYTDEALLFCADDGTQLVSEQAEPPPSALPTMVAPPQFTPPPPGSPSPPTPKRRKWLAVTAVVFALLSLPLFLCTLVLPMFWSTAFLAGQFDRLLLSLWGVLTGLGILLTIASVITGLIALGASFTNPIRYGGRVLAVAGPALSILAMVIAFGVFAILRTQAIDRYARIYNYNSNDNYNSNYNSNRSDNDNSDSNSNSADNDNSNSSDSSSASTDMSETDKYRLFYAAAKTGDTDLQQRAARKIGIVDSSGMPTSTYQSFVRGTVNWAFTDREWVQTMDTPAKARAYVEERLGSTP